MVVFPSYFVTCTLAQTTGMCVERALPGLDVNRMHFGTCVWWRCHD